MKFEMNALDIEADDSIRLIATVKPLRITYNAVSNVTIVSFLYICVCVHVYMFFINFTSWTLGDIHKRYSLYKVP